MTNPRIAVRILVPTTLLALACAGGLPGMQTIPMSANPNEQIDALSAEVASAKDSNFDVLAPTWFGRADGSLQKARELRDRGGEVQAILDHVARGRAELQQAQSFAGVMTSAFSPVIQARVDARTAGAEQLASYSEAERKFLELGSSVESDNLAWAKRNAEQVERDFRELELAAIKKNAIERIEDLIAKAKADGADKLAPKTFAATQKLYEELDRFVTENRYAQEETTRRAEEALFEATRLVQITQEAKLAKQRSPEQIALDREALVVDLSGALGIPDSRNQSSGSQKRGIENAITQLRQDRDFLGGQAELQRARIALLEGQSETERERIARLEAQRRFNDRFAAVSATFSPQEAEVYKKGQSLVIRMRSIPFPVGSSVVLPESYPLLAKVQRAIESFDDPRVVVEGHTDSTGSTEVNDRVSQGRADAVKAYFVANNTVTDDQIIAVGKSFSDPLASDRTAEGRAQNRRIDIIIDAYDPDLAELPSVAAEADAGE